MPKIRHFFEKKVRSRRFCAPPPNVKSWLRAWNEAGYILPLGTSDVVVTPPATTTLLRDDKNRSQFNHADMTTT